MGRLLLRTAFVAAAAFAGSGCFYDWNVEPGGGAGATTSGPGGGGEGGAAGDGGVGGAPCADCAIVLADNQASPRAIALADDFVYWANADADGDSPALLRVPSGGGRPEVLNGTLRKPLAIAIADGIVYVTEFVSDGRLLAIPIAGGDETTIDAPGESLSGVAANEDAVFYCSSAGTLRKWNLPSGPVEVLGSVGSSAGLIALSDEHVFGTRLTPGGGLWRVPIQGGATEVIGPEAGGTAGVSVADGVLAYTVFDLTRPEAGAVRRTGLDGSNLITLAVNQAQPAEIVWVSGTPYWVNSYAGTVVRGASTAGAPVVLVRGQSSPNGIAAGAGALYWTNNVGSGKVMKFLLPR